MHKEWAALVLVFVIGCASAEPTGGSYYEERIAPIVQVGCVMQTTGCHVSSAEGSAAGNLALDSYDSLMRRRDALPTYGPYPYGLLLMKVTAPVEVAVETLDPPDPSRPEERFVRIQTDFRHAGGAGVAIGSQGFDMLRRWIADGYRRNGTAVDTATDNSGACVAGAGTALGFDPAEAPTDSAAFQAFVNDVEPVLQRRCAGSRCHGAVLADLHLSCGQTEEERRWDYFIATAHLSDPVDASELLRRPLANARGGSFHGGGDTFPTPDDGDYRALAAWAETRIAGEPGAIREEDPSEGYRFFVNRVEPVLVRKGCFALNCHSPISTKLPLRGGSQGSFSRFARAANYRVVRKMLAVESPDPNQSRVIAKNLYPHALVEGGQGIFHRGGSLLEDLPAAGGRPNLAGLEDCAGLDTDGGDLNVLPAYCVLARWQAIERADAIAAGRVDADALSAVLYVDRPLGLGLPLDFDSYRPGADLRLADASLSADGATSLSANRSLLSGCGLDSSTTDIRGTSVSWDGTRLAFGARESADAPLRLYWANADGSGCERIPNVAPAQDFANGMYEHDFDPAFAPDGRLVFASTRGNLDPALHDYMGPTRTPAQMQPNANLYVYEPSEASPVRQLTFLLNQEVEPDFMADGRVIYTAEKRELGFHQLALRRQILDGGDYHPLYAQRPSMGFSRATEVTQLPNLNFVFVASDLGVEDGAGTLAVFNRSLGPDQDDRDPGDRAFLHSLDVPAPGVLGGLRGVFRSPASLPSGRILASCDLAAMGLHEAFDFDLCEVDPTSGAVRVLLAAPGRALIEAAVVYQRPSRGVLASTGGGIDQPLVVPAEHDAQVRFNDFPMIASLMFENIRAGRPIDSRVRGFDVLESLPPPVGTTSFDDVASFVAEDAFGRLFVDQRELGHVPLFEDGSALYRLPGGTPVIYRLTGADGEPLEFEAGAPFEGMVIQHEQEQYYPGEQIKRSIPRRFFNAVCGGCHGSINGRELDVAVDLDVISGASINQARGATPVDLTH